MENEHTQVGYVAVTGASSGIGYETAKAFAGRGKNLIVIARRRDKLAKLKLEIQQAFSSIDVVIKICDLSVIQNVYELYESLQSYKIDVWINNAGFGNYEYVAEQNLEKTLTMLRLNVEALTVLSSLYVRNYKDIAGSQLLNISSAGGYTIVPTAITYCAAKFYVSTFTEGLARELQESHAKLQAKVLAPAATKTEFGKVANDVNDYDYDKFFGTYHTSAQMAAFLLELYDSNQTVGAVDRETFEFRLSSPLFAYAGTSKYNQENERLLWRQNSNAPNKIK